MLCAFQFATPEKKVIHTTCLLILQIEYSIFLLMGWKKDIIAFPATWFNNILMGCKHHVLVVEF